MLVLAALISSVAPMSTYTRIGDRACLDHPSTRSRFAAVTSLDSEIARCEEVCDSLGVSCVAFDHETVDTGGYCRFYVSFATDEYTFLGNGSCKVDINGNGDWDRSPPAMSLDNANTIQDCGSNCSGLSGHIGFEYNSIYNDCLCFGYNLTEFTMGETITGTPNINIVLEAPRIYCYTSVDTVFDANNLSRSDRYVVGTDVLALSSMSETKESNCQYYVKDYTDFMCNPSSAYPRLSEAVNETHCRDMCSTMKECIGYTTLGAQCNLYGVMFQLDASSFGGMGWSLQAGSATCYKKQISNTGCTHLTASVVHYGPATTADDPRDGHCSDVCSYMDECTGFKVLGRDGCLLYCSAPANLTDLNAKLQLVQDRQYTDQCVGDCTNLWKFSVSTCNCGNTCPTGHRDLRSSVQCCTQCAGSDTCLTQAGCNATGTHEFRAADATCRSCGKGMRLVDSVCTHCQAGTYHALEQHAEEVCTACDPFHTSAIRSVSRDACVPRECGRGQRVGPSECVPCVAQTFMPLSRHKERTCSACPTATEVGMGVCTASAARLAAPVAVWLLALL